MNTRLLTQTLAQPRIYNKTSNFSVPSALVSVWVGAGKQFQETYPLDEAKGLDGLIHWWLLEGVREFPGLADVINDALVQELHLRPVAQGSGAESIQISPLIALIVRCRPDLAMYADKPQLAWQWWVFNGMEFYRLLREDILTAQLDYFLSLAGEGNVEAAELLGSALSNCRMLSPEKAAAGQALNRFVRSHTHRLVPQSASPTPVSIPSILSMTRKDVQSFINDSAGQREQNLWHWWWASGGKEYLGDSRLLAALNARAVLEELQAAPATLGAEDARRYLSSLTQNLGHTAGELVAEIADLMDKLHFGPLLSATPADPMPISPLMDFVHDATEDLHEAMDLRTSQGRKLFLSWWHRQGQVEILGTNDHFYETELQALAKQLTSATISGDRDLVQICFERLVALSDGPLKDSPRLLPFFRATHFDALGAEGTAVDAEPTPLMLAVHATRAELSRSFDLSIPAEKQAFWQWWRKDGASVYLGRSEEIVILEAALALKAMTVAIKQGATAQNADLLLWFTEAFGRINGDPGEEIVRLAFEIHGQALCTSSRQDPLPVSPLMSFVYAVRGDVNGTIDLDRPGGLKAFIRWWYRDGHQQVFGCSARLLAEELSALSQQLLSVLANGDADLIRICCDRLATLARTAVNDDPAFLSFLDRSHYDHLHQIDNGDLPGSTPLMQLFHAARPDLQQHFDLSNDEGRLGYWLWWLGKDKNAYLGNSSRVRQHELEFVGGMLMRGVCKGISDSELLYAMFRECCRDIGQFPPQSPLLAMLKEQLFPLELSSLTPLLALIVQNRPDLESCGTPSDYWTWWHTSGAAEYLGADHDILQRQSSENARARPTISLAGYPRGEFGLGEDIRLLRASLQSAGLEPDVIRVPWKISAREGINEQVTEADEANFECDVMIYVMPAFDTLTLLNKVGPRAFTAHRRIGYWQWELSKFPEPAMMAFDLIDEVWCHSEHAAEAFRSATDKPVIKVPLPVLPPVFEKVERTTFKLKKDSFVVFTSFDGASSISRKNPIAAILAFQQAFPSADYPDAKLVVKAMNALDDSLWRDCVRKSYLDDRIQIRNEVLDRLEYYQLLACCDVVLSMHRAEGFGRLMAEAMALGIPVIATGYSGNLDFMNEDNSWLVAGTMCDLVPGDYPFHTSQVWMEPDVESAAKALHQCYSNMQEREGRAARGQNTMNRYSPINCGKKYLNLLGLS